MMSKPTPEWVPCPKCGGNIDKPYLGYHEESCRGDYDEIIAERDALAAALVERAALDLEGLLRTSTRTAQAAGRLMLELAQLGVLHEKARLKDICEAMMRTNEFLATPGADGKTTAAIAALTQPNSPTAAGTPDNPAPGPASPPR